MLYINLFSKLVRILVEFLTDCNTRCLGQPRSCNDTPLQPSLRMSGCCAVDCWHYCWGSAICPAVEVEDGEIFVVEHTNGTGEMVQSATVKREARSSELKKFMAVALAASSDKEPRSSAVELVCPVCSDVLRPWDGRFYCCCMARICVSCCASLNATPVPGRHARGRSAVRLGDRCPFCRTPRAKTVEEMVAQLHSITAREKTSGLGTLAEAQIALGDCYRRGSGVELDDSTAVELYAMAAANGHPVAMHNLAYMHMHGKGVAADLQAATILYGGASRAGFPSSQVRSTVIFF